MCATPYSHLSISHPFPTDFKNAFEAEYNAVDPDILLAAMDLYPPLQGKYYNQSFSVVQSSGMGKSRMMDHTATLRFTLPFNIHEDMSYDSDAKCTFFPITSFSLCLSPLTAYPPFDKQVMKFITEKFPDEEGALTRPLVFLETLFNETLAELAEYPKGETNEIARKWYDWLKEGSTANEVGATRKQFYDRVVRKAQEVSGRCHECYLF